MMSAFRQIVPLLFVLVLGGCAAPQPYDYTAYRANRGLGSNGTANRLKPG